MPLATTGAPRAVHWDAHDPLRRCQTERWVKRQSLGLFQLNIPPAGLQPLQLQAPPASSPSSTTQAAMLLPPAGGLAVHCSVKWCQAIDWPAVQCAD